jgi:uncharacterized protein (TIGR02147 family)
MPRSPETTSNGKDFPDIFLYLDYRKYLRDLCEAKKKEQSYFSYRYLSQKVHIKSAGFFSWVLKGKRNISDRLVLALARFFKMNKAQTAYFEALVNFNQSDTHEQRKHAFEKLLTMRRGTVKQVDGDQIEFYRKWYYSAVRELLPVIDVTDDNAVQIGAMLSPAVKPAEVRGALSVLERLGMARKDENGVYRRTDAILSSRENIPFVALYDFQISGMELAKGALDAFEKSERELSTVTMSIDDDAYLKIIEQTAMFRAAVMEIARSVKRPTRVMQLNMQLFPLSKHTKDMRK